MKSRTASGTPSSPASPAETHVGDEDHPAIVAQIKEGLDLADPFEFIADLGRVRTVLYERERLRGNIGARRESGSNLDVADEEGAALTFPVDALVHDGIFNDKGGGRFSIRSSEETRGMMRRICRPIRP